MKARQGKFIYVALFIHKADSENIYFVFVLFSRPGVIRLEFYESLSVVFWYMVDEKADGRRCSHDIMVGPVAMLHAVLRYSGKVKPKYWHRVDIIHILDALAHAHMHTQIHTD